jgi:CHASE2 domain-containing sensor protein
VGKIATLDWAGSFEQGFRVALWIGDEHAPSTTKVIGTLPANLELPLGYEHWRSRYLSCIEAIGAGRPLCLPKQPQPPASLKDCQQAAQQVSDRFNQWLKAESFRPIWQTWLAKLHPTDDLRVLLQTQDERLQKLPWHQWELLLHYPQAELALSALEYDAAPPTPSPTSGVNILAILGHSDGIDIQGDRQTLQHIAGTAVQFLPEPALSDLTDRLWQQPWRILFFAGHSSSQGKAGQGQIAVNPDQSWAIAQLKYALQTAAQRGLQLAILNSCDGLGLAKDLAELHIPQLILMREPVPDAVAQAFLKHFLQAFSTGKSLHQSVRQARERLQGLEHHYPCASWLPVLYQNPAAVPPTWNQLIGTPRSWRSRLSPWLRAVGISAIATTAIVLGRELGWLQRLELPAFDYLLQLRSIERPDSRLLIVGINDDDLETDEEQHRQASAQERGRGSISNGTLDRLLTKLTSAQPRLIGLDIYRDFPMQQQPELAQRLQQTPNLIAICRTSDTPSSTRSNEPPPDFDPNRVGFADFVVDPDGVIRRHLLFMDPESASTCTANYAFSVQLAARYLAATGSQWTFTPANNLQLGEQEFVRMQSHTGGYVGMDAGGNQILLNYRQSPAPFEQVNLRQLLKGEVRPDAIKNRIVLIGYVGKEVNDYSPTPYGEMPGVIIHAHMISQMLSAVQDRRSLLWSWSQPWEIVWIAAWALSSGLLMELLKQSALSSFPRTILVIVTLGSGVSLLCYFTLTQGGWIPWVPPMLAIATTAIATHFMPTHGIKLFSLPFSNQK